MEMTVNGGLSTLTILRERRGQLTQLREAVSTKTTYFSDANKVIEPQYDVKKVDAMISKINIAIMHLDQAIKAKNADTKLNVDLDLDSLLASIE